jgi:DNA-binding MarR family transcriptional regulator
MNFLPTDIGGPSQEVTPEGVTPEGTAPPSAAPEDLAVALEARIAAVFRLLLRRSYRELSRTATAVLANLRDTGARRITDLAAAESVAQPTMTTLVVRMERDGLVQRASDPADRRGVLVSITDEGLATLRRYSDARAEVLGARLSQLDAADREAIAAALPALDRLAR